MTTEEGPIANFPSEVTSAMISLCHPRGSEGGRDHGEPQRDPLRGDRYPDLRAVVSRLSPKLSPARVRNRYSRVYDN